MLIRVIRALIILQSERFFHLIHIVAEANGGLMKIFAEFAKCKSDGFAPNSPKVQSLVGKSQDFITENYYTCTDEILAGLGQMYVCDERFKKNIDKYGEGTAEFVAEAIKVSSAKNL